MQLLDGTAMIDTVTAVPDAASEMGNTVGLHSRFEAMHLIVRRAFVLGAWPARTTDSQPSATASLH